MLLEIAVTNAAVFERSCSVGELLNCYALLFFGALVIVCVELYCFSLFMGFT